MTSQFATPEGDHGQGQEYAVAFHIDRPHFDEDYVRAHPEQFFVPVPVSWLKRAAPANVRTFTVNVGILGAEPTQLLRHNPLRRSATALVCNVGDANAAPLALGEVKSNLSNNGLNALGAYVVGTPVPRGPFFLVPPSPQPVQWNSTGELFVVAPWNTTGAYFVSVVEYFD